MEEEKKAPQPPQPPIIDQLKEYAETRFKLSKYKVIEKSTSVIASLVRDVVTIMALVLTFLFASFTLALFLGEVFHSYWKGFGCVALLYLLFAIIIMSAKKSFEKPIINVFIKKIFQDNE